MTADGHLINNVGKPAHEDRVEETAADRAPRKDSDRAETTDADAVVPDPANDWPAA